MKQNFTGLSKQKVQGPPPSSQLSPKELIKEHFYLSKFLQQLAKASNIPTLPDTQSLERLIEINKELEDNAQSFRHCFYEQFLQKKLLRLQEEYSYRKKQVKSQK